MTLTATSMIATPGICVAATRANKICGTVSYNLKSVSDIMYCPEKVPKTLFEMAFIFEGAHDNIYHDDILILHFPLGNFAKNLFHKTL